ncbi:MAG: tRNA 2-thiocytidine biosynthesis TtcA family protein [Eubacteriales bacterium]|nr:tRNA 2-thiocytidine biosynthesis TtcA family protein [Eubacteriales bacterium]MDD4422719.1 tRNA 2-thiocytidine biosynthesis TtcA family protein [Eubacteriales bacterium]HBR32245.1 tRNA 2-thiocytidine(32) synthetase TtcA [Clostridiales bacterium]
MKSIQQILSYTRRAISDYDMICGGDRIAVGVSGGKDSLTLLCAMRELQRFFPSRFEVLPITIEMGFPDSNTDNIDELCGYLGLKPNYFHTEIYKIVFELRNEKNPCSLCANIRRGALNRAAAELGCNKVALAHHFEDTIETFYMNLFNNGRIDCFSPVTYLERAHLTVIRPFIYVPEKEIKHFIRVCGITTSPKSCPADGSTDRFRTKELLNSLSKTDKGIKQRLFGAMEKAGVGGFKVCPRQRKYLKTGDLK